MKRDRLGRLGEAIAADALERAGLHLLARNVRFPEGEIDLVAAEGDTLVFVEVRTRRGGAFGSPEESVTLRKQERLVRAAQRYLQQAGRETADWRIDLVAVELDPDGRLLRVEHLRAAVEEQ
ncbi:MAG: YraN family protein [Chloroflexota bacterium]|nr:YraN family protein [Dehalococcoidia bacterium]MDW8254447.1 YraN family protein [Chloroflexota bacterium]